MVMAVQLKKSSKYIKIVGKINIRSLFLDYWCIRKAYSVFFSSKSKIKGSNSCLMANFRSVKLTDVKMCQTKYLVYSFTAI